MRLSRTRISRRANRRVVWEKPSPPVASCHRLRRGAATRKRPSATACRGGDRVKPAFSSIDIGTAGEHLTCASLLLSGHRAFLTAAGLPYDVAAEINGHLYRIAVKSSLAPRRRSGRPTSAERYHFSINRALHVGGSRRRVTRYTENDVDIVACVALDIKEVGFVSIRHCPRVLHIAASCAAPGNAKYGPRSNGPVRHFSDLSIEQALP